MTDFYAKRGDRLPIIEAVLQDADGVVDLSTGVSAVRFSMRRRGASALLVDRQPATIEDAAAGRVSYAWADGDTATAGSDFIAEFEVEFDSGKRLTFPNDGWIAVTITDDVA